MEKVIDKITQWGQIATAALFLLFSFINLVRTVFGDYDIVYSLCFAALLYLSWKFLSISWGELKAEQKKKEGGEV